MNDLPDLPGLESIEEEVEEGWPCCGCLPVPIVIIGGVVKGYWLYGLITSAALVALVLVLGWLSNHKIKTDVGELSLTWPHRRKRIRWVDVTGAETVNIESESEVRCICIEALEKSTRVPVEGLAMAGLEASIWQHLRRVGKASGIKVSEDAHSFWLPIPEDIPAEMDWDMVREPYGAPRARYSLKSGYILCDFVEHEPDAKPDVIDFAAVTTAGWDFTENECDDLVIESETNTIYVTYDPQDAQSWRFLLAVIRRLRALPHVKPLAIPKELREAAGPKLDAG